MPTIIFRSLTEQHKTTRQSRNMHRPGITGEKNVLWMREEERRIGEKRGGERERREGTKAGEERREWGDRRGRRERREWAGRREESMGRRRWGGGGEHKSKGDELRHQDGYRKGVLRLMEQSD